MGVRRKVREYALQMLFAMDVTEYQPDEVSVGYRVIQDLNREAFSMACRVVDDIHGHIREIDEALSGYAKNWKIPRMAVVDRNLLRLGIYEIMFHPETPFPVILHEALGICEEFSEADSCQFIKGVLDAAGRELRPDENGAGKRVAKKKDADVRPDSGGDEKLAGDGEMDWVPDGGSEITDKDGKDSKDDKGSEDSEGSEGSYDGQGGEDGEGNEGSAG
jgi:N utilization substance protein B